MNQAVVGVNLAGVDRHLKGVEREVAARRRRDLPADHETAEHIDDERDVDEADMGLDVGGISHPEPV